MTTSARHSLAVLLVLGSVASARPAAAAGLYGSTTVTSTGWRTDMAYNRDRGEFLVVWANDAPSGNSQIWGRRYRESGDPVAAAFPLTDGTQDDVVPQVAYDHHVKRYLVTWRLMGSSAHAVALMGRLFDTNAAPASGELTLYDNEPFDVVISARNQREHGPSDVAFLVAWRTTFANVKARRVSGDGTLLPVTDVGGQVTVGTAYDPRVDRFIVVYRDASSVRARLIGADGTLQPEFTVGNQGTCGSHDVDFDPASRRYLIAWSAPAASGGCELKGSFYSSATVTPALLTTVTIAGTTGTVEQRVRAVEAEPGTFVVANAERTPAVPQGQETLRLRRFRADGLFLNEVNLGIVRSSDHAGLAAGAHGATPVSYDTASTPTTVRFAMFDRWFTRTVHGRGDADGDGRSDLTVFQPWSSLSITKTQFTTTPTLFAVPGAQPVLLDWDGDGRTDRCVWEPGTGQWWILQSSDGASVSLSLGRAGDIPVPGDYLGLGRDQAAVFRPSTGEWVIQSSQAQFSIGFGQVGDMPVPADWDGDGDVELGLWRPSTGQWLAAETDGTPVSVPSTAWGQAGDFPFGGDVVGDARADQVVYRRQLGVAWVRDGATGATSTITLGDGLFMPLDWDGDGKADLAAADHESQVWRIRVGALTINVTFGTTGDIPAAH